MMKNNYLDSTKKQFEYYKSLGDRTFEQLSDKEILWQSNTASNSISILVKHLSGNMLSRWTNFRTEDGEKEWRNRDNEFKDAYQTKNKMLLAWDQGWNCLFEAIDSLKEKDLSELIYIRNEGHTILEALQRQLCHYSYHVGQLVSIGKMIKGDEWQTLSIAKNKSVNYNKNKFDQDQTRKHFTDNI